MTSNTKFYIIAEKGKTDYHTLVRSLESRYGEDSVNLFKADNKDKQDEEVYFFDKNNPIQWRNIAKRIDTDAQKDNVIVFMSYDPQAGSYNGLAKYYNTMKRHLQWQEEKYSRLKKEYNAILVPAHLIDYTSNIKDHKKIRKNDKDNMTRGIIDNVAKIISIDFKKECEDNKKLEKIVEACGN